MSLQQLKTALKGVLLKLSRLTGGEQRAHKRQHHWQVVLDQANKDLNNPKLSKAQRGLAKARAERAQTLRDKAHRKIVAFQIGVKNLEAREAELKKEIAAKQPPTVTYQMGGWGGTGAARMQRTDQGQDFEIPVGNWITSPGHGEIIGHSVDRPFPNGFGNPYAIVKITSGPFAIGNGEWYVGHANADVRPVGTKLNPGDHIARANNSLNSGWGWCELGKWDGGPHPMGEGQQYHHLFVPVKLPR